MALVEYAREGAVGRLTLNRPEAGNAVDPALIADLAKAIDAACADPGRAILIDARGANFSLGGDVRHLAAAGNGVADVLRDMAARFHEAQLKLCELPLPIVSAVQGNAIGGGFGLALSADFILCTDTARFSTGYSRLGLSADAGVSYFLTRALGARRATALLISSCFLSAEEARTLGIVDDIVSEADLQSKALAFADQLASGPTAAYAAIKRLTDAARTSGLADHLDREAAEIVALAAGDQVPRAIDAIATRQQPVFQD
ncbi:enoyl-CoA hydratase/isomerase family protein [Sphingobium yanoikuyae]|jgi:2-(1,2-epoxy-1,2-dihydrophenyl)acetyl-CoA isomerase|uniref:Enoyl-CoA hydratase/isomerase family protein n=1 Tax=Sphingobium yanoikuyae TaxID=13690 RepID=A0A430C8S5_SPHYA|nr:enoyl-CoA hydratase/isomerase family protein [Sphingobium yanoikuyae]RSU61370.1 enoyl-CoA hydratase/isomerase family protein [Sphingobium yanoikuyae]